MEPDDRGINETRSYACEIVAWRFLTHLSEHELIDYLLYELPPTVVPDVNMSASRDWRSTRECDEVDEFTGLLSNQASPYSTRSGGQPHNTQRSNSMAGGYGLDAVEEEDPFLSFVGLNALEIAAIADAKKFLSQRMVQKIINAIWCGEIVFWDSLNVLTKKKAQRYNARYEDAVKPVYLQACTVNIATSPFMVSDIA